MKALVITVGVLLVAVIASLLLLPVRAFLISLTLPDYPDWPSPLTSLSAEDRGEIYFATQSPYDLEVILADMAQARPTTGLGYLSYPQGASEEHPVPAMVLLPGSGGIAEGREADYARWLTDRGIAAFIIEYYAPRGFDQDSEYLIRTSSVTEFDLIADAYAALRLLGTSPLIDAQRIGLIGFSYGGMATRLAMDQRIQRALGGDSASFSLHIDTYGPCFQNLLSQRVTGAPLLTLRGTEDASNDLAACAQREEELRELGVEVTAHVYPGAGHAWENKVPRHFAEEAPYLAGCEIRYDNAGKAWLDGQPVTDYPVDAPHATKMAARFASGLQFRDCVGWGYTIGRDDATRDRAYQDIERFLQSYWSVVP
ncbi:MAG: dienelactone hydrolase family protein [Pseudomonadota bacterium]